MPASSTAHAPPRRRSQARATRERGGLLAGAGAAARVRWDRLGRAAMLCVMAALIYLYLSAGMHMFSTWRQSHRDGAAVVALEREHAQLQRQHEQLSKPGTLESAARQLGMKKKNEQPYVISGLPKN
ncbi:MAG: FtsB family cell division protein [Solirubrobacteraceae bacterium]